MTRLATVINKIIDIINTKQSTLVSGENIKKLNGTDIVGSGNIPVKTVGGESILGDGDVEIIGTGTLTTSSQNVIGAINELDTDKAEQADLTILTGRVSTAEGDINALDTRVTQAEAAVGTPLVASTVAGMTDKTKIYVYTGSETGYTSGNWYYWNGTAWTSGGVYNSTAFETDTTLTLSGKAADAKITGVEIADLKSDINSQVGIKSIAFNLKKAITNNVGIGNIVDITGEASNYTNSAVVECSVGDILYITGYGWGQQRLWSFLDSDNKLLSISAGGLQATDLQLIAPPNTAKAVFNVQSNYDFALYKVSTKLDSTTPRQMVKINTDLSVAYSRKLSNIHNDIIFVASIADWDDLPDPINGGVFECKRHSSGYAIQTFTVNFNGSRYNRIVSTAGSVYRDWNQCQLTYIGNPSVIESDFGKRLSNISQNYIFNASPAGWDDTPTGEAGVFENWRYSSNYNVQTFKLITRPVTFTRFVHSTTHEIYSDWVVEDQQTTKKILCVGDSVAEGWRNNGKGFVGDLGMPYSNEAVGGATLSNIRDGVITSIPNQLINSTYENPDIVISNGGINDFFFDSPIGTVPTSPAYNDELASNLNLGTALGGLEMLLYTMIKKYPKAQRFFVLSHKIRHWENVQATPADGSRRYNYHELMESIRKTCELYNCYVIDIFNKSIINTGFSQYVAETAYPNNDPYDYVDHDEVHPLAYGYEQGYLPLVREAIKIGTRK